MTQGNRKPQEDQLCIESLTDLFKAGPQFRTGCRGQKLMLKLMRWYPKGLAFDLYLSILALAV